jgi:DNA-binding Xre family transcriptional regulator
VYLHYQQKGEDVFIIKPVKTKQALRMVNSPEAPQGFYVYLKKRKEVSRQRQWSLEKVMAERRIKGKDLAREYGVSLSSMTRLKNQDFIPPIGGRELKRLCKKITKLSPDGFVPCKISALIRD